MLWTTNTILQATGGELVCGVNGNSFSGISIDSRTIAEGQLFVAIEGEIHDGHRFVDDVIAGGIKGLIIRRGYGDASSREKWRQQGAVAIAVADTTTALGDLAAYMRRELDVPVVAITGSNGKTTTRAMTSAVLSRKHHILSTRGNYNNLIGMPLTLLDLSPEHERAVLELGMNRPGEIKRLGEICKPDIGIITNIGPAHLEGFDSIDGIMQAKGELLETLQPEGVFIANADDMRVRQLSQDSIPKVLSFGTDKSADVKGQRIRMSGCGINFDIVTPDANRVEVHLNHPGRFMVSNALAAAAVGCHLGLDAAAIRSGLEAFEPEKGRLNIHHTANGMHLIDDTYNANPASMEAAILMLADLKGKGRSVLVAGDMLELGKYADQMHRNVGSTAARCHIDRIYAEGAYADAVVTGAREEGFPVGQIVVGTKDDILDDLKRWLQPGDWVLVKGSRKMEMEIAFNRLRQWADR